MNLIISNTFVQQMLSICNLTKKTMKEKQFPRSSRNFN